MADVVGLSSSSSLGFSKRWNLSVHSLFTCLLSIELLFPVSFIFGLAFQSFGVFSVFTTSYLSDRVEILWVFPNFSKLSSWLNFLLPSFHINQLIEGLVIHSSGNNLDWLIGIMHSEIPFTIGKEDVMNLTFLF